MKISKISLFLLLIFTGITLSPRAETVYIDDKQKFVWSRSGPSTEYRLRENIILGKLEVLQRNTQTEFVQVRDEAGKEFWLKAKYLTANPSAQHQLIRLQNETVTLKASYAEDLSRLENRVKGLAPLEKLNKNLQDEIAQLKTELEQARQKGQMYQSGFNSEAFFAGAVVILGGILLGWVLSKLGGQKRRSGWG